MQVLIFLILREMVGMSFNYIGTHRCDVLIFLMLLKMMQVFIILMHLEMIGMGIDYFDAPREDMC